MATKSPTTVDLSLLSDGPRTRAELGATRYAITLATREKLIAECRRPKDADKTRRGLFYKLTAKGKRRVS
jgi:hypothetical protein